MRVNDKLHFALGLITVLCSPVVSLAAPAFNSSDVAILWPVKVGNQLDDVFKMRGSGLCHLPSLDLLIGSEKNTTVAAVSREHFNQFAEISLGRGPKGLCNEIVPESMVGGSNADVLNANGRSHLSLMRGIASRTCQYENWRIVGLRYDPCFDYNKKSSSVVDRASLEKCTAEFRLVAQPFNLAGDVFAEDQAVHIIYRVRDRAKLVAGLAKIAKVTRTQLAAGRVTWDAFDNKQDGFRPHPGLRAEMDNCLPGRTPNGPVITEVMNFLKEHARDDLLEQIAWMTTSNTNMDWSFGFTSLEQVKDAAGNDLVVDGVKVRKVVRDSASFIGPYDNFSQEAFEFDGIFPFNSNLLDLARPSVMPLFGPKALMKKGAFSDAEKQEVLAMLETNDKLLNPSHINQGESTCFSCHVNDQAVSELKDRKKIVLESSSFRYPLASRWPPFAANRRSLINFRNFGIGPNFEPGVSIRTLNEIDVARKLLNIHYADVIANEFK